MTSEGLYPPQMQFDTVVLSLTDEVVGTVRRAIVLLFGAVGFLLLIACANVANLLLARAEARQREIAVRSALGAGSLRVVRQLLTESLVLSAISAALGLALAFGGVRFLAWWNPANIPRVSGVALDGRVLAFTAIVAFLTSIVFSLAPALRAMRVDLTDSLKDGSQSSSSGGARQRFRNGLVVVEMALAVVLLIGAGLMLRTLWSLQRIDLGFDPVERADDAAVAAAGVATGHPRRSSASTSACSIAFARRPGVRTAGAVRALPLASTIGDFGLRVEGYVPPPGHRRQGGLGDRDRRLPRGDRGAGRARAAPSRRPTRPTACSSRSSTRRWPPVLGRPGSDRRAHEDWRRAPSGPGSRSSGSSPTCATTASPAS